MLLKDNFQYIHPNNQGFSLLEMAVVMLIISLIIVVGSVGKSLIEFAKVRNQVIQIQDFDAAATIFNDAFGHLPGDIPSEDVDDFFYWQHNRYTGGVEGTIFDGGNGNGLVGQAPATTGDDEVIAFFAHLSMNSIINIEILNPARTSNKIVIGQSLPEMALESAIPNEKFGIFVSSLSNNKNYIVTCAKNSSDLTIVTDNCVTAKNSTLIDSKLDDGVAGTGYMKSFGNFTWPLTFADGDCRTGNNYKENHSQNSCGITFLLTKDR